MDGTVSNVEICNLAYSGDLENLKALILSNKSLATKTDQDSRTALHWACSAGHKDIVDFLLSLGIPVDPKDDAQVLILTGVSMTNSANFIRDDVQVCWTPLHIAASAGREEIVKVLISKGAQVNAVNQNGCSPLHYAASRNRYEIASMLLENGADPNISDSIHSTPLHRAAAKGNLHLVQLLLKHTASTNLQDSEGNTPLHLACDEERVEEAKLLVENGASIYIENKEEKTPLQMAKGGLGLQLRRMVEG